MRKIAIYDSFTEPKHRRLIDETAARAGFTVDYYAAPAAVPADKRGDYEVIYGMPKPGELKDFVNLKWFCGSFAGVDAYLDDSLYPSPEVMLSNSSGAYGVTIAEHMVMVTLMLLRHAPVYCADQAAGRWGRVLARAVGWVRLRVPRIAGMHFSRSSEGGGISPFRCPPEKGAG